MDAPTHRIHRPSTMDAATRQLRAEQLGELMRLIDFLNWFRSEKRKIWYRGKPGTNPDTEDGKECNGDHSFQLAIFVWFVAILCNLKLDMLKLILYALVHDLPEAYSGDECMIARPDLPKPDIKIKKEKERAARERIREEWGDRFPEMVRAILDYDAQEDWESRLVYSADKLVSQLNVLHDEGRADRIMGVTYDAMKAYKEPRCQVHPLIGQFFEVLDEILRCHPEYFAPAVPALAE